MITAYPINFISDSGGGGGGDSDWTTAQVTLISSAYEYYYAGLCIYEGEYGPFGLTIRTNENIKIGIPLYKGTGYIRVNDLEEINFSVMPIMTGDIVMDENGFKVTGDGTITLSGYDSD